MSNLKYADLHDELRRGLRKYSGRAMQKAMDSQAQVYKVKVVEDANLPGGTLALAPRIVAPTPETLEWKVSEEGDEEDFVGEAILPHIILRGIRVLF